MAYDFETVEQSKQYLNDAGFFKGENLAIKAPQTATIDVNQQLLDLLMLKHMIKGYTREQIAQDLIRTVNNFAGHGDKKGYAQAVFSNLPIKHRLLETFGELPEDKETKYKNYAIGKAGIIDTDLHTSKDHTFMIGKEAKSGIQGAVKLVPHRVTAISGLSPVGELDEAGAFVTDYILDKRSIMDHRKHIESDIVIEFFSDNKYLPLVLSLMIYGGKENGKS